MFEPHSASALTSVQPAGVQHDEGAGGEVDGVGVGAVRGARSGHPPHHRSHQALEVEVELGGVAARTREQWALSMAWRHHEDRVTLNRQGRGVERGRIRQGKLGSRESPEGCERG